MKEFKYILVFAICTFSASHLTAQKQVAYNFQGFFTGANMTVQCRLSPIKPWTLCECIDSITVNGQNIPDLLFGGYELDIANKTKLDIQDTVNLMVYYKGCEFRIMNPNQFLPSEILPVKNLNITEKGVVTWDMQQNFPDLKLWVQIEQFKWDEWVRIGPTFQITDQVSYNTDISKFLTPGDNKIRAVVATIDHARYPCSPVIIAHKAKKVKYKYNKKLKKILFNQETDFQIWNEEWIIASKGYSNEIDLKYVEPGIYYLRYSNREKKIKIKELKTK